MNRISTQALGTALVAAALTAPLVALAAPASASGGGTAVRTSGRCVGGGVYALKAKHDNGRIEVEYEVDVNRVGRTFAVRLTDNGVRVYAAAVTTVAPSGSFTVHRAVADRRGIDTLRASAVSGTRSCGGTVRV